MHDAMQVHFSSIAELPPSQRNLPRWDLWTFFAGIHDRGTGLGGIIFDTCRFTHKPKYSERKQSISLLCIYA